MASVPQTLYSSPVRLALPMPRLWSPGHSRVALFMPDGEMITLNAEQAAIRLPALGPLSLIHAPASFRRLGLRPVPCLDLLELFAFVLPARTAAPTPRGLCVALDLDPPRAGLEAEAAVLPDLAAFLLRRLAAGCDLALNRDAAGLAARMGRAGWGWAPFVLAALGSPGRGSVGRRPESMEAPAGMGGSRAAAAPLRASDRGKRGAGEVGRHARRRRRAATGPVGLCRRRLGRLRPAPDARRPASGARRSRDRHRQNVGLHRAGQPVGGEELGRRVDQHVHPPPAAADRRRVGPAVPRSGRTASPCGGAQGAGELPVPAEPGRRARSGDDRADAGLGHSARADRPLGAGQRRRRHPGRRPAGLDERVVRDGNDPGAGGPAR